MFTRIQNFVKNNTFISFIVLAYALSWWPWLWAGYVKSLGMGMFPWGPSIAAIIITAIIGGKTEVNALLKRYVRVKFPVRWYVLALGLPLLVTSVAAILNIVVVGAAVPAAEQLAVWPEVFFSFPIVFLVAGAQEELGWRGFALERLQKKYSGLGATMFVAVMGIFWHLPLLLVGDIQWPDVWVMFAAYTVMSYLYNSTRGSVLIVMLMHAMNNAFSGEFVTQLFNVTADKVTLALFVAAGWTVVAIIVVIVGGPKRLGRTTDEAEQVTTRIEAEPVPAIV